MGEYRKTAPITIRTIARNSKLWFVIVVIR